MYERWVRDSLGGFNFEAEEDQYEEDEEEGGEEAVAVAALRFMHEGTEDR